MNLVSVAFTAEEAKEYGGDVPAAALGNMPKYPWGLCLELNDDTLKKLGITTLPAVGSKLLLQAHVQVTSISESQQLDNDKEGRMSAQITEMALATPDATDPAEKIYK